MQEEQPVEKLQNHDSVESDLGSIDVTPEEIPVTPELIGSSPGKISRLIEEAPAQQGAKVLEQLPLDRAAAVGEYLDPKTAARIFKEIDAGTAASIILAMHRPEAAMVLSEMDPDDRVDILGLVDREAHDELLSELDAAMAAETRNLEQYHPDTAGGIMTTDVTAVYEYLTVDDAINLLRRLSEELEQIFYVYVIDRLGRLVGVLSMRDLILARPERQLRHIMIKNVRSVPATMDQEEVARIMRESGYLALPVVDDRNRLIGLITVDDVVDVIQEEATEDVQKLFGAGPEERLNSPWHYSYRKRVGWLLVNLLTAFAGASIVAAFEATIAEIAMVAALMPIVSAVGGNASVQAMAVTVRGLIEGRPDRRLIRQVLVRELFAGIANGFTVGIVILVVAVGYAMGNLPFVKAVEFGMIVGVSMIINVTFGCMIGTGMPIIIHRLGFDPAQSATIFTTASTDVLGFFLLLGLVTLVLL